MSIKTVLEAINKNPTLLKNKESKFIEILKGQQKQKGDGRVNNVTCQEACFAELLDSFGYKFVSNKSGKIDENYYRYQNNGDHRKIDFVVFDKESNKLINFDLKHSTTKRIKLNDGWFQDNIIYLINWTLKKQNRILIGYGEEIRTDGENEKMKELIAFKNKCNNELKKFGSLGIYLRFANDYRCDKFTDEYSQERFISAINKL